MSIAATSELDSTPTNPLMLPLAAAAVCAALADWLFFGWQIGISLALFYGVIGIAAVTINRIHATRFVQITMALVFIAGLLTLIEDVNLLSVLTGTLATAAFVIVLTTCELASWPRVLLEATTVPLRGPFRFIADMIRASIFHQIREAAPEWLGVRSLVAWIIPLSAFGVFLGLFTLANPVIEYRLDRINLAALLNLIDPWRITFWTLIVCAIWPLLSHRIRSRRTLPPELTETFVPAPIDWDFLFDTLAMTRALVLFNALFALQSGLDLLYLWGGAALPNGMSHAEYAHRGAYPLIVTALLAAGFALIAMRPGGPAESSRWIRPLVLAWIGQNILLVISSIFRLDLYIAALSLTYLRLAAFIWMGLVAIGLGLMLIQIIRRKSVAWLFNANAISLALTLYGCCFLNAPWVVAHYNVEHCREVGGSGPNLDLGYLASLGSPQVLPPIEARRSKFTEMQFANIWQNSTADQIRKYRDFRPSENWRAWGFRTWRLERYFANTSDKGLPASVDDPANEKGDK
jgi:Domain of unknown function (DUF4173)